MKTNIVALLFIVSVARLLPQELTISGNIAVFGAEHKRIIARELRMPDLRVEDRVVLYDIARGEIVKKIGGVVAEQVSTFPARKLIAFVASEVEHDPNLGMRIKQDGRSGLFVYDGNLSEKLFLEGVRKYSWSQNGTSIAYIKGHCLPETYGFIPSGVYTVDLSTHKSVQIADTAYDIYWARYDNNIYLQTWRGVLLYDTRTQSVKKTNIKGIYISPDGKFYFNPGYEAGELKVYDRADNRDITRSIIENSVRFPLVCTWGMTNSTLLLSDLSLNVKIIDVGTKIKKEQLRGFFLGFGSVPHQVLFLTLQNTGGKPQMQRLTVGK